MQCGCEHREHYKHECKGELEEIKFPFGKFVLCEGCIEHLKPVFETVTAYRKIMAKLDQLTMDLTELSIDAKEMMWQAEAQFYGRL